MEFQLPKCPAPEMSMIPIFLRQQSHRSITRVTALVHDIAFQIVADDSSAVLASPIIAEPR